MVKLLHRLRDIYCNGEKVAIFLDNATLHKAHIVRNEAAKDSIRIRFVYNVSYRCDLQGCEQYWKLCKNYYRKRLTYFKVNGINFDQMGLVEESCNAIDVEKVKKAARVGFEKLATAQPILALAIEPEPPGYPAELLRNV